MSERPPVLISGTSRGIGRHLAEHYLARGHAVFGCSRGAAALEHAAYRHFRLDVGDEVAVKGMLSEVRRAGGLGVLICNAAVNPALGPALLMPAAAFLETLRVNVLGTFLLCREAAKLMARARFGRIVTLSSMAVRHEVAGEAAYTASKAAVTAFTRVLAKELHPQGITCNVVAPAAVPTELSGAVSPEALRRVLERNAIPRMGEASDVADAIDWLIRPESAAITGQVIYLGGA